MPTYIDTPVLYAAMVGEKSSARDLAEEYRGKRCVVPALVAVECLDQCRLRMFANADVKDGNLTTEMRKNIDAEIYTKLKGVLQGYGWSVDDPLIVEAQHLCAKMGMNFVDCYLLLKAPPDIVTTDDVLEDKCYDNLVHFYNLWSADDKSANLDVAEMVLKMHPEIHTEMDMLAKQDQLRRECKELLRE